VKKLIVNADDFGLAEEINRGIIAAHRDGILTSASLLANGPAFDDAIGARRHFPRLSIGMHLNLSQGWPVSAAQRVPTLVNERRELHLGPFQLWVGILRKKISLEDIRTECRAQIVRLFDAGVSPTHLDGHLHVHLLPPLSPILIGLALEFCIPFLRCPAEDLEATLPMLWKTGPPCMAALERSAVALAVSSLARRFREQLRPTGLRCPDAFWGLAHTGFLDGKALAALLAVVPNGTAELMCHPGYSSPQVAALGGKLNRQREAEVLALTAPEINEIVKSLGVRLTNFGELAEEDAN
jgi:predicted glycoside hydrolase/deacetylase ChbG (UPF0249 family)